MDGSEVNIEQRLLPSTSTYKATDGSHLKKRFFELLPQSQLGGRLFLGRRLGVHLGDRFDRSVVVQLRALVDHVNQTSRQARRKARRILE